MGIARPRVTWESRRSEALHVEFLGVKWPNFTPHTGYSQVMQYVGEPVKELKGATMDLPTLLRKLANSLVLDHASMQHYTARWFCIEAAAAVSMLSNKKAIYHLLYGDISYRFLGRLSGFGENRVVATFHQPSGDVAQRSWQAEALARLDAAIVVGTSQLPMLDAFVGQEKVFHIPLGVDTTFFRPADRRVPESQRVSCLFVGSHYRDIPVVQRVIQTARSGGIPADFVVLTDASNLDAFAAFPEVPCYSRVSDLELLGLYRAANILVEPLKDSTANNALLEGMACGLPIVATDVGSVRDYLDEGCALFVPLGDADAVCRAIWTLSQDPGLRECFGQNGRRRARRFDWTHIADEVRKVYQSISAPAAPGLQDG